MAAHRPIKPSHISGKSMNIAVGGGAFGPVGASAMAKKMPPNHNTMNIPKQKHVRDLKQQRLQSVKGYEARFAFDEKNDERRNPPATTCKTWARVAIVRSSGVGWSGSVAGDPAMDSPNVEATVLHGKTAESVIPQLDRSE
jgi:hypothetical protein